MCRKIITYQPPSRTCPICYKIKFESANVMATLATGSCTHLFGSLSLWQTARFIIRWGSPFQSWQQPSPGSAAFVGYAITLLVQWLCFLVRQFWFNPSLTHSWKIIRQCDIMLLNIESYYSFCSGNILTGVSSDSLNIWKLSCDPLCYQHWLPLDPNSL